MCEMPWTTKMRSKMLWRRPSTSGWLAPLCDSMYGGCLNSAFGGWFAPVGLLRVSRKRPELSCSPRSPPACFLDLGSDVLSFLGLRRSSSVSNCILVNPNNGTQSHSWMAETLGHYGSFSKEVSCSTEAGHFCVLT